VKGILLSAAGKDLSPCWEEVLSSIPAGSLGRNVMAASASLDSDVNDLYL